MPEPLVVNRDPGPRQDAPPQTPAHRRLLPPRLLRPRRRRPMQRLRRLMSVQQRQNPEASPPAQGPAAVPPIASGRCIERRCPAGILARPCRQANLERRSPRRRAFSPVCRHAKSRRRKRRFQVSTRPPVCRQRRRIARHRRRCRPHRARRRRSPPPARLRSRHDPADTWPGAPAARSRSRQPNPLPPKRAVGVGGVGWSIVCAISSARCRPVIRTCPRRPAPASASRWMVTPILRRTSANASPRRSRSSRPRPRRRRDVRPVRRERDRAHRATRQAAFRLPAIADPGGQAGRRASPAWAAGGREGKVRRAGRHGLRNMSRSRTATTDVDRPSTKRPRSRPRKMARGNWRRRTSAPVRARSRCATPRRPMSVRRANAGVTRTARSKPSSATSRDEAAESIGRLPKR